MTEDIQNEIDAIVTQDEDTLAQRAETLALLQWEIAEAERVLKERKQAAEQAAQQLSLDMQAAGLTAIKTQNGLAPRAKMVTDYYSRLDDPELIGFLNASGAGDICRMQVGSWKTMQKVLQDLVDDGAELPECITTATKPVITMYGKSAFVARMKGQKQ